MTISAPPESASSVALAPEKTASCESLLLIEDNPVDALRTMSLLRSRAPYMSCQHVTTLAEATPELLANADCVLLDLSLPDAESQEGLKELLLRSVDLPVVVLTGLDDPLNTGLESLRNGAQDYLTKADATAIDLERSIRYAIERKGYLADLAATAVVTAAAAVIAESESVAIAATTTATQSSVQTAAASAATAAAEARASVDLPRARAAATKAETAALAAVAGAAQVATMATAAAAAATAAADAAIAAATAHAAEATASAMDAVAAATALAGDVAWHGDRPTRVSLPRPSGPRIDLVDDIRLDSVTPTAAPGRSTRNQVLVIGAKLAVAITVILIVMFFLAAGSAS